MSFVIILAAFSSAAQACAEPVRLSPELAPWTRPAVHLSGELRVGVVQEIDLQPRDDVRWVNEPERRSAPDSRGAVLTLKVEREGIYRVALADSAWIDIGGSTGLLRSIAHGHGPNCSGIRKIVDFELSPGTYHIQLSGAETRSTRILVASR